MGQELRDKYPIYPRSCPQEGEVGHTIDRCIKDTKSCMVTILRIIIMMGIITADDPSGR